MNPHHSLPSRWLAVVALAITAGIHISLAPDHLREAPYAGVLFIALSAAALTFAVLLATSDHQRVWWGAAALSAAALLAYVVSRSLGLPLLNDDVGDWLNPLGVVAAVSETATALVCWNALRGSRSLRRADARIGSHRRINFDTRTD
jgi:hypothetical protein